MPAQPFLGQIMLFAGNFPPAGWAFCDGQLLSIAANDALYSIIGTTYGGDGQNTFALPDLRGRVPINPGQGLGLSNRVIGQALGEESHTLTSNEMPQHTHLARAKDTAATSPSPTGNTWARTAATQPSYGAPTGAAGDTLSPTALYPAGGNQPHENRQPSLSLNFCIAVEGIYPSRTGLLDVGQFIAEIVLFAGDYAPSGWADCAGQTLAISSNQALFSLVGTTYGGNGQTNFQLPDLRSRAPMHAGGSGGPGLTPRVLGERAGSEAVTVLASQMPAHTHAVVCRGTEADNIAPMSQVWAKTGNGAPAFGAATSPLGVMNPGALRTAGGTLPHNNMAPSLGIRFLIATVGIFPSRN